MLVRFIAWNMQRYNSKKSTVLVCRNKAMMNAVRHSFIVNLNGDVISESEKVKYLGHIIM